MSDFERFWKVYPRKVGKLAAIKEWLKQRPQIEEVESALAWQCAQWEDPQYIPHPRTWLAQGRWMDEQPKVVEKADMYGHIPPCRDWQVCRDRVLAEARTARAEGRELRLVNE